MNELRRLEPGAVMDPGFGRSARDIPRLLCVGFDPGVKTGWATLRMDLDKLVSEGFSSLALRSPDPDVFAWSAGTFTGPQNHIVDQMMALTRGVWLAGEFGAGVDSDVMAVARERFDLRILNSDPDLLSPVRVTAAYDYAARDVPVPFVAYPPSDTKRIITDDRLHKLNLWIPGEDHPRDALRQCILFARNMVEEPYRRRYLAACRWLT